MCEHEKIEHTRFKDLWYGNNNHTFTINITYCDDCGEILEYDIS